LASPAGCAERRPGTFQVAGCETGPASGARVSVSGPGWDAVPYQSAGEQDIATPGARWLLRASPPASPGNSTRAQVGCGSFDAPVLPPTPEIGVWRVQWRPDWPPLAAAGPNRALFGSTHPPSPPWDPPAVSQRLQCRPLFFENRTAMYEYQSETEASLPGTLRRPGSARRRGSAQHWHGATLMMMVGGKRENSGGVVVQGAGVTTATRHAALSRSHERRRKL